MGEAAPVDFHHSLRHYPPPIAEGDEDDAEPAPAPARDLERPGLGAALFEISAAGFMAAGRYAQSATNTLDRAMRAGASRLRGGKRKDADVLAQRAEQAKFKVLSNRFRSVSVFTPAEQAVLTKLGYATRMTHQAGSELVIEGDLSLRPMYVVSGWAARVRILSRGRRQILALLLPGDGVNLNPSAEPVAACSVVALTTVETVDGSQFMDMASDRRRYPGISHAVERADAQQQTFLANQIARLGRQGRLERMANLLMEMCWRTGEAGLAEDALFPLPLSTETLGDALGMTPRDAQGALRALRSRGLFRVRQGRARVIGVEKAKELAEFRPPEACKCGRMRLTSMRPN